MFTFISLSLFIMVFAFSQTIRAQSPGEFNWPEGKQVAISLSFDDARPSQVIDGIPLLNKYDVKATFYVVPDRVKPHLDEWKRAVAAGHEMGNHSIYHPCSGNFEWAREHALEKYTLDQMQAELIEANKQVKDLLGVEPVTFAYPCGQKYVQSGKDTKSYVPVAAELFTVSRGWLDEAPNDPLYFDPAQATGMSMDRKSFDEIRSLIDQARDDGHWLILAGHEMGGDGNLVTELDMLEALLNYAADPANGIWLAPVKDVASYIEQFRAN